MKKISYLLSIAMMAAAGLFCACSSSDDDVAEATADETSTGTAYMTVNMQVASGSSTRADENTENTEVDGANFENKVEAKNSVFLFYDASGAYVGYGTFSGDWSTDESTTNGIEKTITIQHTGELSSIVYCLVVCNYGTSEDYVSSLRKNYNDATYTDLEKTKLLTTTQVAKDPTTSDGTTTYTNFLMTSALRYADGSLGSLEVDVSNYIKESTSEAQSNPVSIYIERVTAKANIAAANNSSLATTTAGYIAQSVSGDNDTSYYCSLPMEYVYKSGSSTYSSSSVKINISGWAIDAYNSSSNLFKQLPSSYTTPSTTTSWYHSSSGQIYWASDANYSSDDVKTSVQYYDYDGVNETSTETMYLFENTACYDVQAGTTYNVAGTTAVTPAVLVTAAIEITPGTGDGTTETAVSDKDLYISTGIIYDLSAVKNAVAEALNNAGYVLASSESDTETSSITADDITLALEVIDGTVTVKAVSSSSSSSSSVSGETSTGLATTVTKGLYLKSDDGLTQQTDVESIITKVANGTTIINYSESSTSSNLKYYKSGHCYYMVPIEQMSSTNSGLTNSSNTAIAMNGVVRNHWYDITLNTISGIGRAITDDDDDITIIPEEETVGYLNCTINILSWNKKTQSIDF